MNKLTILLLTSCTSFVFADMRQVLSSNCGSNEPVIFYHSTSHTDINHSNGTVVSSAGTRYKPMIDLRYPRNMTSFNYNYNSAFPNSSEYTGLNTNYGSGNKAIGTNQARYDAKGYLGQIKCVRNDLAFGTVINGSDSIRRQSSYGGTGSTFSYVFPLSRNGIRPWKNKGNFMVQLRSEPPYIYSPYNKMGQMGLGLFIHNTNPKKHFPPINYIINLYNSANTGVRIVNGIDTDNYSTPHVGLSLHSFNSDLITKSIYSQPTKGFRGAKKTTDDNTWEDFFRVNISHQNLKNLFRYKGMDTNPEDWVVTVIGVQYEVDLNSRQYNSIIAGSIHGLSAYVTDSPK